MSARHFAAAASLGLMAVPGLVRAASAAAEGDASPATAYDPARRAEGRALFSDWSCGTCHTLADAGADGDVGPAFDGNASLDRAFIVDRVTRGGGVMPAFGGQMTERQIAAIAAYIIAVRAK